MKTALALTLAFIPSLAFAAIDISVQGLVSTVIYLLIIGVIIGILLWLVAKAPFIPPEGKSIITYVIYFIAALIVIAVLLSFAGVPIVNLR